jgi:hypothetical protein
VGRGGVRGSVRGSLGWPQGRDIGVLRWGWASACGRCSRSPLEGPVGDGCAPSWAIPRIVPHGRQPEALGCWQGAGAGQRCVRRRRRAASPPPQSRDRGPWQDSVVHTVLLRTVRYSCQPSKENASARDFEILMAGPARVGPRQPRPPASVLPSSALQLSEGGLRQRLSCPMR